MSRAYLPVLPAVRDRANEYLAGMAARGFEPMPADQLVRQIETSMRAHAPRWPDWRGEV